MKIAVVGGGWRSEFFVRLAHLLLDRFELVGQVVRKTNFSSSGSHKIFASVSDLLAREKPDFVIVAVSWESNPEVVGELVAAGIPVLCETPPAPDQDSLQKLWLEVGNSDLIQVAEQYPRMPMHAARLQVARSGEIGTVSSVQVSSTHGYHAVSLMRAFLGAGFAPVTVNTTSFTADLIDPLSRGGWNQDISAKPAVTVLATLDFGDGKSGLYDFTDNQWHNQLRHRRLVIRGSRGEISDVDCVRLVEPEAIVTSKFMRYQTGHDLNLDGADTEHISFDGQVVYRNQFAGLRLMDEEIAICQLMVDMADWVDGSRASVYSLAEASQDHLISLAIDKSQRTGAAVTTGVAPWAS